MGYLCSFKEPLHKTLMNFKGKKCPSKAVWHKLPKYMMELNTTSDGNSWNLV